jgi:hypothetical protein
MGLKNHLSRGLKHVAPTLATICMGAWLLALPRTLLAASSKADGQSKDQSGSVDAKIQSTMINSPEKQVASTKTPAVSAASVPSAIFLHQYHTAPNPAEAPTRRAKITW